MLKKEYSASAPAVWQGEFTIPAKLRIKTLIITQDQDYVNASRGIYVTSKQQTFGLAAVPLLPPFRVSMERPAFIDMKDIVYETDMQCVCIIGHTTDTNFWIYALVEDVI